MSGWSELFRGKSSIYALDEISKEWVDRGISGQLIMFQNNQFRSDIRIKWSKNQREIWWRLMNGKLKPKGERAWVLKAWDTSNNKQEILAIRFSDVQLSQQFQLKFHQIFPPPQQQQQQQQPQQQVYGQQPQFNQFNQQRFQPQQQRQYQPSYQPQPNQQVYNNNGQYRYPQQVNNNGWGHHQNNNSQQYNNNGQQQQKFNHSQQASNGTWECAVCTYSNDISKQSCIMCGLSQESTKEANGSNGSRKITIDPSKQPQVPQSPNSHQYGSGRQQGFFNNGNNNNNGFPNIQQQGGNHQGGHNGQSFNFDLKQMQQQSQSQQRILAAFDSHNMNASAITSPHGKRNSWICPMCTLHNSINVTRCDACNASRNIKKPGGNGGGGGQQQQPQQPQYRMPGMGMGIGGMNPMINNQMMINGMANMNMNIGGQNNMNMNNGMMNNNMGQNNNMNNMMNNVNMNMMQFQNEMKQNQQRKQAATVQEFQNSASDIACYNDNPSQVFSTLRSVAKKLLKDDVRYRTLDTTNPKVMERLIGFEGVLDFLMLLGFESDAMGMKLICEEKPSQQVVRNAIEVLNTYESRLGLGRKNKNRNRDGGISNNKKEEDEQSYITLGGPDSGGGGGKKGDKDQEEDTLTLEQIIIWSTHENMRDNDTMETLILTHKQFTNSLTLLKNLRRRFDVPIPNDIRNDKLKIDEFRSNVQKRIQLKVIKSLRDWMKQYWDDDFLNDLEVQKELMAWLSDLEELKNTKSFECPWIAPLSSMVSKEYERFKLKSPNQDKKLAQIEYNQLNPKTGVPKHLESVSVKKGFKLSNTTAEDLADQITLMDYKIFSNIQERECIGQAWKKKKEQSPNVLAMIQQFNNLTVFVQLQILSEKSLRDRSKAIKRVIKMGERFKTLKNFNSLCAVLGALNSSPIHRLKAAWQKVPEKQLNLFESFKSIFVNTRNFRNFRTMFRNVSPPAIPYFGLFLQDLVFIDDGNDQFKQIDNFKQHGFMVNFNKCVRTMDRIKNIRLYQTNSYKNVCKSQDFLQKILYQEFHKMKDFTEDAIWEMSTQVKKQDEAKK